MSSLLKAQQEKNAENKTENKSENKTKTKIKNQTEIKSLKHREHMIQNRHHQRLFYDVS